MADTVNILLQKSIKPKKKAPNKACPREANVRRMISMRTCMEENKVRKLYVYTVS